MSGWKRLGVVISVLWLIGAPIYAQVEEFQQLKREFEICVLIPSPDIMKQIELCDQIRRSNIGTALK